MCGERERVFSMSVLLHALILVRISLDFEAQVIVVQFHMIKLDNCVLIAQMFTGPCGIQYIFIEAKRAQ